MTVALSRVMSSNQAITFGIIACSSTAWGSICSEKAIHFFLLINEIFRIVAIPQTDNNWHKQFVTVVAVILTGKTKENLGY